MPNPKKGKIQSKFQVRSITSLGVAPRRVKCQKVKAGKVFEGKILLESA